MPEFDQMEQVGDEATPQASPLPPGWDEAVRLEEDPATIPDPAEVDVPDDLRAEIEAHMAKYPDRHSAALPALSEAQKRHGWCSPEAIAQVAAVMQVTPAYLSSVATFYDMLRTEPRGSRYVYVCTSVACHLRGAKRVHDAIQEAARQLQLEDVEIREFECLGACDMAPMASVDGRYVGPIDRKDAPELVLAMKQGREALPGRSLEDQGYALPWDDMPTEPVVHPDVSPAGGTVKDADEIPPAPTDDIESAAAAPDEHGRRPLGPGHMHGGKEDE